MTLGFYQTIQFKDGGKGNKPRQTGTNGHKRTSSDTADSRAPEDDHAPETATLKQM